MNAAKHEQVAKRLGYEIEDAKRDLAKAAEQLARRAAEATAACDAMLRNEPTSTMWVRFAAGDAEKAAESLARLEKLYEQQKLVAYLMKADGE